MVWYFNFLEILAAVSFDWAKIVKSIKVINIDNKVIVIDGKDIKWSFIPKYPACQTVDLNNYFDFVEHVPVLIEILFNKIPNLGVILKVEDESKSLTKRPLLSNDDDYEGIPLQIENLTSGEYHSFSFTLSEKINPESVEPKGCKNYPTKQFFSYRDCDMDFVYNEMKSKYDIMPFWAAKTLNEVTNIT